MTGSQASARFRYQKKKKKVAKITDICKKCVGATRKEIQTIAMIRGGSYIDQEQAGQAIDSYTDFRHPPFRREVEEK